VAGRTRNWDKAHERLDKAIEELGQVVACGPALETLARIHLSLEELRTELEALDTNWRAGR
jgi:hypothetical protein